jgi:hypothetical protein
MEKDIIHIFIDEAGDLGFNKRSSKKFVVAYLITDNPDKMRTKIKRFRKRLRSLRKKKRIKLSEFKFRRDKEDTRLELLELIANSDMEIGYVVIDKRAVKQDLREKPNILYNYLLVHYVLTNVLSKYNPKKIVFVVDKSLSRRARQAFNDYFRGKLTWKAFIEKNQMPPEHEVKHMDSRNEPCLQAADYVAGAAFSKFEHGDPRYYRIIENKIIFRNSWGEIRW